jgi:hypothetical protein
MLLSDDEGRRERPFRDTAGVLVDATLGKGAETSDMGGEGGSGSSDSVSPSGMGDFDSGGVVIRGELAVDPGDPVWSKVGDSRTERSVEMVER